MKHEVLYQNDGEVVCTCGEYFKIERVLFDSVTAVEKWAEHVRLIRTSRRRSTINKAREALDAVERGGNRG